ncbi:hypothetical protein [Bradyrhizobium lablabi]|uniref:hypothetical protein n=1 Tax=Bradyrhizobium lablabi TaxID=722472 RepID=UPI001BA4DC00|nr:hypothetical protein [Bradyrhizobium lablabi]MBR0695270.1 hypothetical protein [Bradyrhizobium lablabi]
MSICTDQDPFVVVQCPSTGDAAFASRWLAADVEADFALTRDRSANPDFESDIERLRWLYEVEFSPTAMAFTRLWLENGWAFHLNLAQSEWSEPLAYMVCTGLQHYQMSHPGSFAPEAIARTLLLLAGTEDEDWVLHPELMLATMSDRDARRCVRTMRLRRKTAAAYSADAGPAVVRPRAFEKRTVLMAPPAPPSVVIAAFTLRGATKS